MKRLLAKLGLLISGALTPLIVAELALRILGPILPGNYETGVWFDRDPDLGHFHVAGASAWIRAPEFTAHLRFNSDGLRGPEVAPSRRPGQARVLMLGDSFIEAKEVFEEQTVAARLAAHVPDVEWLNSGVFDWGTAQQLLYLRHHGQRFQPDLVVLFFYVGNDVADAVPPSKRDRGRLERPVAVLDDNGELQLLPWSHRALTAHEVVMRELGRHFALAQVYRTGIAEKMYDHRRVGLPMDAYTLELYRIRERSILDEAWKTVDALLAEVQAESERIGARFLLVTVPAKWQVHQTDWATLLSERGQRNDARWDLEQPNHRLAQIAAERRIQMLDLLPALRQSATAGQRLYFPINIHWTPAGHAAAAEALADHLSAAELLPALEP